MVAGGIAQASDHAGRVRELHPHPWRHDGITTRDRDPRHRIGQWPALHGRADVFQDSVQGLGAGVPRQHPCDGVLCLGRRGRSAPPDMAEHRVEPCGLRPAGGQEVIGGDHMRRPSVEGAERLHLVAQHVEDQTGICLRVIHMARQQAPVVIMFDEVVIWVAGKRQGVEPQRVDRCLRHPRQPRPEGQQVRQVVTQNVVADQVPHVPGGGFDLIEGLINLPSLGPDHAVALARHRRQIEDARGFGIDLQIHGQAMRQERRVLIDGIWQTSPTRFSNQQHKRRPAPHPSRIEQRCPQDQAGMWPMRTDARTARQERSAVVRMPEHFADVFVWTNVDGASSGPVASAHCARPDGGSSHSAKLSPLKGGRCLHAEVSRLPGEKDGARHDRNNGCPPTGPASASDYVKVQFS